MKKQLVAILSVAANVFSASSARCMAIVIALGLLVSNNASAANQYFTDAGGPLTWDQGTTANWGTVSGGPYTSLWTGYNIAYFEGTGGTVNVSGTVQANGITFAADGYILSGGTLGLGGPGGGVLMTVNSTYTATLGCVLSPANNNSYINKQGTGTLNLSGVNSQTYGLYVNQGTLAITGGSLTSSTYNATVVGNTAGNTAVLTINGGNLTHNVGNFTVGATSGSASLNVTSGTLDSKTGTFYLGNTASTVSPTVTINGGTMIVANAFLFQNQAASTTSTLSMTSGSLTVNGSFKAGNGSGSAAGNATANSAISQTGGTITINNNSTKGEIVLAGNWNGTNTATFSGNAIFNGNPYWGPVVTQRGTGTMTVSGTASVTIAAATNGGNGLTLAGQGGSTCTLNLDGGTLQVVSLVNGSGSGTLNFNGGTLKAGATSASFLTGLTAANVKSGGARIDVGAYNIDIGQALLTGASPDGGLTKSGAGNLALTNSNTFTGGVTVNNGTLCISSDANLGVNGSTYGTLTLNGGTLFNANNSGYGAATNPTLNASRNVVLGASGGTFRSFSGGTITVNGAISGSGSLSKTDGGTLALSGANTYSGKTSITGGTISIAADSGLGTAPDAAVADQLTLNGGTLQITATGQTLAANRGITVGASGGTITSGSGISTTLAGVIAGSGALTYSGGGSYALGGVNTNSGTLTIDTATVTVNSGASLFAASLGWSGRTVTVQKGGTLVGYNFLNNNGNFWGQAGDNADTITFGTGGGTFKYLGTDTFTAPNKGITVSAGVTGHFFVPTGNSTTWNGSYSGRNFIVNSGGTLDFNGGGNFTTAWFISGSGNVTKSDGGTLTLSATNTYTGKTSITGGTLAIAADSGLGTAPGSAVADQLTINGGALKITAASTLAASRGITLGASGGTIDTSGLTTSSNTTISGSIAGTGALTLKANGDLSSSGGGAGGNLKLGNSSNSFTGDVTVTSGLVNYAADGSFGNAANKIILDGGGIVDTTIGTALAHAIQVNSGGGTFRAYSSTSSTWSGAITGSGNINRTDGGTLILSGDLSGYTGTFNNQAATTTMSNKIVGGALTVSGGTVNLNGTGTAGAVTVSGGALNVGGSANVTVGAISNTSTSGSLNIATGGILNASSYTASYTPSTYLINGTLSLSGTLNSSWATTKSITGTGTINANAYANNNYSVTTFDALRLNIGSGGITQSQAGSVTFNGTTVGASANWSSSVPFTLNASSTTTFNTLDSVDNSTGRTITLSGALSGSGALTKAGAGTLLLSSANSFTGALTINGGTLEAAAATGSGNSSALGAGSNTINVNSGGTLLFSTNTRTAGYHTGAVNISGGTITFNTGDNNFAAGNTVMFDSAAGVMDGSGAWRFRGSGTVHATAAATGSSISVATMDLYDGTETFNIDASALLTISSKITSEGGGKLSKTGSGTLALTSSTSDYYGGTIINAGTLQVGDNSALGTGTVALNGGVLSSTSGTARSLSNNFTIGGDVTMGNSTNNGLLTISGTVGLGGAVRQITADSDVTLSGKISNGGLTKAGAGTLTLSSSNDYIGGTTVNAGVLQAGNDSAFGSGAINLNGGTLDLAGFAISTDIIYNGGNLIGAANRSSSTSIQNNSVYDLTATPAGSGSVTVESGSTLKGTGLILGATTIKNGALLSPGNSPGFEEFATGLTLEPNSTTLFELGGTTRSDLTHTGAGYYDAIDISGGTFTLDGSIQVAWVDGFTAALGDSFRLFNWTGATLVNNDATLDFTGAGLSEGLSWDMSKFITEGSVSVIPEPGTVGVVATFLAAALLRRRRFG